MENNCEESNEASFIIPGYKDINSYSEAAFQSIVKAIKASQKLPSASDFDYYRTFKVFEKMMLNEGQSILSLMTSLIQGQNIREKFQGKELEEKFALLEEVNEHILENIRNCIDEASGQEKSEEELILAVKPQNTISTSWNKRQFNQNSKGYTLLSAKNISRSQLSFKDKIDNSNTPFMPILKEKPNSIKPLAVTLEKDHDKEEFCHPYEWEIEKFSVPDTILQEVEPTLPRSLDETPLVFVKTEEQLKNLCNELKQQKEFAIDLEHHSYRSFQGFTCLIQISTRDTDYIIDAVELRSELHLLNDTFTDPKIVKVFHGADMDIVWLQRDFGVYVVNMFDTGQAARVLHFAHLSLSYLLKHFCNLDVDKQFQLADWRMRPLPDEMINYARQDTHYLLYIYDCLKNDLIKNGNETKNLLRSAFERSRLICLKKYEKPLFSEDSYMELYKKSKKMLNAKQLYCLKELYSWRDRVARENDESMAYVLPNHMLLQIAETLPREQQGVLACCNPIPPLVRQQLNEIHSVVLNAARSSMAQLAALELEQKAQSVQVNYQIDLNNLTCCPHDILPADEERMQSSLNPITSLPCLNKDIPASLLSKPPSLAALFHVKENRVKSSKISNILSKLYTPFHRYEMAIRLDLNGETRKSNTGKKSTKTKKTSEAAESSIQQSHQNGACEEHMDDSDDGCENQSTTADLTTVDLTTTPNTSTSETISSTALRKKAENRVQLSHQNEACDDHMDDSDCKDQNVTVDLTTTPNMSTTGNFSSTPLRKKSKKKKRKAQPDISLKLTPVNQPPPQKKLKTPEIEVIGEVDSKFVPYDYSKADLSSFSGKKKSKNVFKPGTEHNFKGPGKHHGRSKKHFKQGTFGNKNKQENKKWPENK